MFRILILGLALISVDASALISQQYANCALLTPQEIFEATKVMSAPELKEMSRRCSDQADMFMIVADEQTDSFERQRYLRFSLKAGIASEQFFEAFRLATKGNRT